jgi:hypothetical protein
MNGHRSFVPPSQENQGIGRHPQKRTGSGLRQSRLAWSPSRKRAACGSALASITSMLNKETSGKPCSIGYLIWSKNQFMSGVSKSSTLFT